MQSTQDVIFEIQRLQRNYEFLSYGLAAAWVILVAYVLMLLGRMRKLRREITVLKTMLEEKSARPHAPVPGAPPAR
jgi:CcmD family protein